MKKFPGTEEKPSQLKKKIKATKKKMKTSRKKEPAAGQFKQLHCLGSPEGGSQAVLAEEQHWGA